MGQFDRIRSQHYSGDYPDARERTERSDICKN